MGDWDIVLIVLVGLYLRRRKYKIKNDLMQKVKKRTINRSNNQCRSVIERLIVIEQVFVQTIRSPVRSKR